MTKMFTFLIALVIIFSCTTCYAATSKPVYDLNEKFFVEDFNAMAKAMSVSVLDAEIKSLPNNVRELSGKDLKINLTMNQSSNIEKIWLSSKVKESLANAFLVTLSVLGLSAEEFNALPLNSKENKISVWCKFAKRQIIIEKAVTRDSIEIFIEAESKS